MSEKDAICASLVAVTTLTGLYLVMEIPLWVAMLVNSVSAITIGCILSSRPGEEQTDGEKDEGETIGSKEALRFPLVASSFLVGLYVFVKYINKDLVNVVLSFYFTFLGICCLKGYIRVVFGARLLSLLPKIEVKRKISIPMMKEPWLLHFDSCDIITYVLATVIGALYFQSKFWMLNNLLGLSFAIYGVEKISINSFKIGALLLGGLFIYDVFWVYGTDVMLTVAKNIDAPIKLLFPKPLAEITENGYPYALLGLGDIIVPGVFLALSYRFDLYLQKKREKVGRPVYFLAGIASYIVGLVATVIVMKVFNAGQPALLYLVPSALAFTYGTAVLRHELSELTAYEEA